MKLSQIQPKETRASSFLLIGPQGVGKTIAAASWPKPRIYDVEDKNEGLIRWYHDPKYAHLLENIDLRQVTSITDFIYEELQDIALGNTEPNCDTIIVDSITEVSQQIVDYLLAGRRGIYEGNKRGGDRAKVVPGSDMIIPSWDEFDGEDVALGTMLGFLTTIRKKWDINTICIAHPHSTQGPSGEKKGKIVAKGHKAPQTVVNKFAEIYYLDRQQIGLTGEFKLICKTRGEQYSRTAWNFLPATMDYTNKLLYDVLKEELDKGGIKEERKKLGQK